MAGPIRVLVVDDSILFRTKLRISLSEDNTINVVGSAMDPEDALRKIEQLKPDVITMDVEMPKMNGIEFLKRLMPQKPIPVIVVTSLPMNALDALEAGAVDFVNKPQAGVPGAVDEFLLNLRNKVKMAAQAKVRRPSAMETVSKPSLVQRMTPVLHVSSETIIAIGASTGGTEAIIEVVKSLPESTPGIVIVQHMPPNFTNLYAQRLNRICKMRVKEAQDMDRVAQGQILIAAGGYHMSLKKDGKGYYVRSLQGERVSGHCPSVDVLFDSVADTAGSKAIGVILTGMGADGAKGITKLRRTGAYTIGQDRESCVVYGMPMEAYKMGGVAKQLSLDQIGDEILYKLSKSSK